MYNGILKTFVCKYELDINLNNFENVLFSIAQFLRKSDLRIST